MSMQPGGRWDSDYFPCIGLGCTHVGKNALLILTSVDTLAYLSPLPFPCPLEKGVTLMSPCCAMGKNSCPLDVPSGL